MANIKHKISILMQSKLLIRVAYFLGITNLLLNLYWKKVPSRIRKRVAESGIMEQPRDAQLELTMRCNLKCKICHQADRRSEPDGMTTEQIFMVIDKIAEAKIPLIQLTGGEIFLRRDIIDIFKYIDSKRIPYKINTNSTLVTYEQIEEMKKLKYFECYGTSIDGSAASHDRARGEVGAFQRLYDTIRLIGESKFQKMVCFTMTEDNRNCIDYVAEIADHLDAHRVLFLSEMYAPEEGIVRTRQLLSLAESEPLYVRGKTMGRGYPLTMKSILKKIKSTGKNFSVLSPVYPFIANRRTSEFYNRELSCQLFCKAFNTLVVAHNGDVRVCQFIGKLVGNLLKQSVGEIWNGESIREMRMKILKNKNMTPICQSCCCVEEVGF
jgi:radical SAM protein with 4Fe4S-binding SPASM domain